MSFFCLSCKCLFESKRHLRSDRSSSKRGPVESPRGAKTLSDPKGTSPFSLSTSYPSNAYSSWRNDCANSCLPLLTLHVCLWVDMGMVLLSCVHPGKAQFARSTAWNRAEKPRSTSQSRKSKSKPWLLKPVSLLLKWYKGLKFDEIIKTRAK